MYDKPIDKKAGILALKQEHANRLKESYLKRSSNTHRKKFGQYFTPDFLARLMANWVLSSENCRTVLDPAFGLGDLIEDIPENVTVDGFEIEPFILSYAEQKFSNKNNIRLYEEDFLYSDWKAAYDGVICNPPYIRFKHYEQKQAYLNLFHDKLGLKLSGFTNMYVLFMIKALTQLKQNGRAAFIIPSDFLNARYGTEIKEYLLSQNNLQLVAVTDFKVGWFDQAATTSAIFFFDNKHQTTQTEFVSMTTSDDLSKLEAYVLNFYNMPALGSIRKHKDMNPGDKWRKYYQPERPDHYSNVCTLDQFARINRGIATGANHFFCFTESKRLEWKLPNQYFVPVLSKASQVSGNFMTTDLHKQLIHKDQAVKLLHVQEADLADDKLKRYITHGERNDYHKRYLTKRRSPWFKNENREPADILVSTFNRSEAKFIRNEAGIRNLTPFHCLYVKPPYKEKTDLLMAFFMTDIARDLLAASHREYGNGLKKLEPNDLKETMVIDIDKVGESDSTAIRKLYNKIREIQLASGNPQAEIDKLNRLFLALMGQSAKT